jgi:hypothetical protein
MPVTGIGHRGIYRYQTHVKKTLEDVPDTCVYLWRFIAAALGRDAVGITLWTCV